RDKGGGMRLAHESAQIKLGVLVRSVEPDFFLVECLACGSACTLTGRCRLTDIFGGALDPFLERLDGHTIADVLPPQALTARRSRR
ncbi:MAG: Rrf2 family transcriptional regulator, partial [Rhizobacter sp.]|nr:Rrf2 family transcriptional regulator [Rhizobacter sp.]